MGDDVVVSLEDPVREAVVAEELPDVLDRVQLGRPGRQGQERDVSGHDERAGEMPACPVEDEDGVGVRRHRAADLEEMLLHRLRVAERHDDAGALARGRADRTEDVGPGGALVVRRPRPGAAAGHLRVSLFFWPIRASSWNQSSMRLPGCAVRISATRSGRLYGMARPSVDGSLSVGGVCHEQEGSG
jgi:hypothetical protein